MQVSTCHEISALKLYCFTDGDNKVTCKKLGGVEAEEEQLTEELQEKNSISQTERHFISLLQLLGQTAEPNEVNLLCLVGYKNIFEGLKKKKKKAKKATTHTK